MILIYTRGKDSICHAYVWYEADVILIFFVASWLNFQDRICAPMAFVLLSSIFSQWLVVMFTAVSACSLIVFGKKLNLGRCDWKLLFGTFGLATGCAGVAWGMNVLGPADVWLVKREIFNNPKFHCRCPTVQKYIVGESCHNISTSSTASKTRYVGV
jgi:hypothetical protein